MKKFKKLQKILQKKKEELIKIMNEMNEIKNNKLFNGEKNDLYSLGITLYEIWLGLNDYQNQFKILDNEDLLSFHSRMYTKLKKKN